MAAINTFDPFPTRVVEEYFKPEDLDVVAGRFFNYLTSTYDSISNSAEKVTTSGATPTTSRYFSWPSPEMISGEYNIDTINDRKYYLKVTSGDSLGTYPIISNNNNSITIDPTWIDKRLVIGETGLSAEIHLGTPTPLRTINYMDLMNQTIGEEFKESYFILADVTDYADYKYQDIITINNGKINTSVGATRFNIPNASASLKASLLDNEYVNDTLYIRSFNNSGFHKILSHTLFGPGMTLNEKQYNIKVKNYFKDEINPDPWIGYGTNNNDDGNIFAQIIDRRQGSTVSSNGRLTGRGTISLDIEQEQEVNYKITITTLPVFINWAYFVINYISTGTYVKIEEQ